MSGKIEIVFNLYQMLILLIESPNNAFIMQSDPLIESPSNVFIMQSDR